MQKLRRMIKPILTGCMALSFLIGYDVPSALFFGELPYPQKEN